MEMKNISRQSLNVEPEVLMERFNRGDASRTIEGSGLGLTIAKDLMKLMGGWIDITIDGDLFKVKLMLKSAEQEKKPLIINEL
jgi:signal transduction histidine kinase